MKLVVQIQFSLCATIPIHISVCISLCLHPEKYERQPDAGYVAKPACQSLAMLDPREPLFQPPRVQHCQTLARRSSIAKLPRYFG